MLVVLRRAKSSKRRQTGRINKTQTKRNGTSLHSPNLRLNIYTRRKRKAVIMNHGGFYAQEGKNKKNYKGNKQGSPATCYEHSLLKCEVRLGWVLRNPMASERSCRAVWACGAASPSYCHPCWESPFWVELWRWRGPRPAKWPEPSSPPWERVSEHPYRTATQNPLWDTELKKRLRVKTTSEPLANIQRLCTGQGFGGQRAVVAERHYRAEPCFCKQPKKNKC